MSEALEDVLERLFTDEETKDVEIEFADGTLKAHTLILGAHSDAIKGILRHGPAPKKLCWKDHHMEVGRFFLRLMYTGTVCEEDWSQGTSPSSSSTSKVHDSMSDEVPLRLLLGGLEIAKVYLVPHMLRALTEALKERLCVATYNEIFSMAVRLDITVLRLHCLQFAQPEHRLGGGARGTDVRAGMRVMALVRITVNSANVPRGGFGTVSAAPAGGLHVTWDNGFVNMIEGVLDMIEVVGEPQENSIRRMFEAEELSPEVMAELAPLWARPTPTKKRRKL